MRGDMREEVWRGVGRCGGRPSMCVYVFETRRHDVAVHPRDVRRLGLAADLVLPLLAARRVAAVERLPRFGPLRLRLRHRLKRRRDELVSIDLAVLPHEERARVVARAAVVRR